MVLFTRCLFFVLFCCCCCCCFHFSLVFPVVPRLCFSSRYSQCIPSLDCLDFRLFFFVLSKMLRASTAAAAALLISATSANASDLTQTEFVGSVRTHGSTTVQVEDIPDDAPAHYPWTSSEDFFRYSGLSYGDMAASGIQKCSSPSPYSKVYTVSDGENERCFVAITPPGLSKAAPVRRTDPCRVSLPPIHTFARSLTRAALLHYCTHAHAHTFRTLTHTATHFLGQFFFVVFGAGPAVKLIGRCFCLSSGIWLYLPRSCFLRTAVVEAPISAATSQI